CDGCSSVPDVRPQLGYGTVLQRRRSLRFERRSAAELPAAVPLPGRLGDFLYSARIPATGSAKTDLVRDLCRLSGYRGSTNRGHRRAALSGLTSRAEPVLAAVNHAGPLRPAFSRRRYLRLSCPPFAGPHYVWNLGAV